MARLPKTLPNSDTQPKSSNAEVSRRVTIVLGWLVTGKSRGAIVQDGSKRWNVSERQVDDYLAEAKRRLEEKIERDRESMIHLSLERMNAVFDDAYDAADYTSAISAQRELNKIAGLYAPVKQDLNVTASLSWEQMVAQARGGKNDSD